MRGQIPVALAPVLGICPVDDPAGFAGRCSSKASPRRRGRQSVHPSSASADLPNKASYKELKRVALLKSPPLSEMLKVTLKVSHNLYASTLPLLIAAKNGKTTLAAGLHLERRPLADLGVDVEAMSLESGAGGGNGDRVTPRTTVSCCKVWPSA